MTRSQANPHPLFDIDFYRSQNPELGEEQLTFAAYLARGWREFRSPNRFFSIEYYLTQNSGVAAERGEPLTDFVTRGWKEGLNPGPEFDVAHYLSQGPELGGRDPLTHFLLVGRFQGLTPRLSQPLDTERTGVGYSAQGGQSAIFNAQWYLEQNVDVREARIDPWWHYTTFGEKEGRKPNEFFDPVAYKELYGDVRSWGGSPFEHYRDFGLKEGRMPMRPRFVYHPGAPRLLFVGHDAELAGAQKVLLEIVRWFSERTHYQVSILLLSAGPLVAEFAKWGPCFSGTGAIDQDLEDILKFIGPPPDVVYCNTVVAGRIFRSPIADRLKNSYVVAHCHELENVLKVFADEYNALRDRADSWICASPATKALVETQVRSRHVEWIPAFISPSTLCGGPATPRTERRASLGIASSTHLVIGCGTAHWRKDPEIFVDTAIEYFRTFTEADCKYLWIGDGEDLAALSQKVRDNNLTDRIQFLGRRPDASELMAAADLFFLSSREDPFPLVVLEAAQFGVPAVCFSGATGMETFIEGRGCVISTRSAKAAASEIASLLRDGQRRSMLGELAKAECLENYVSAKILPRVMAHFYDGGIVPGTSIIVPNFNHEAYLDERISSIFLQKIQDFELILLDDCSTDGSLSIFSRYSMDPRVRIAANSVNSGGVFFQWRRGCLLSRSDVVWIAESDDSCDPGFLGALRPLMYNNRVNLAFGRTEIITAAGDVVENALGDYLSRFSKSFGLESMEVSGARFVNAGFGALNPIVNASGVLLRKACIAPALTAAAQFKICGDWYIYLRALAHGDVAYEPTALNFFRRHSGSTVHKLEGTDTYFRERMAITRLVLDLFRTTPLLRRRMLTEMQHETSRFTGRYDARFLPDIKFMSSLQKKQDYKDLDFHICFYVHGMLFSKGGIERLVAVLSAELVERGYRVTVACRPHRGTGAAVFSLASEVELFPVDIEADEGRAKLRSYLATSGVSVFVPVLSEWLFEHAVEAAHGLGIPIIASEHNNPWVIEEQWWSRERRQACFEKVDVVHLATFGYENSLPLAMQNKVNLIEHPIARDQFVARGKVQRLGKRIIAAGRLVPQKRFDLLVEAFAQLYEHDKAWELVIFGEGPLLSELQGLSQRCGVDHRISFPGNTDRLHSEFGRADIFVLSSEFEGMSVVLLEAMASGLPIVAFERCVGVSDVVTNEHDGILASVFSSSGLADALLQLARDPDRQRTFGLNASRTVKDRFNVDRIVDQWEAMLQAAVN